MHYTCPLCKTENKIDVDFQITEYICRSCSNLIDIDKNTSTKVVKKPVENVVLEIGQKGIINHIEYNIVGIVIRKYGTSIFWREYFLKDYKGNDAFLSESDGHWVFLHSINGMDVKKKLNGKAAELHGRNYRWYETTECYIHAASGFFEDRLDFGLATYREYVNATQMISQEQSKGSNEYFFGRHISKHKVKKAFHIQNLPNYSGVGIIQPFYFNFRQTINVMAITALLICLVQLYVVTSRTNKSVFEQEINFADVKDKEMVSKSFELSGGSAPLKVDVSSNVDNSWANVGLSLVNENTNEIAYTSKDIEEYHGYEDGENWSEGSKSSEFNFCGVAPGKYHFLISAEKESNISDPFKSGYQVDNGNYSVIQDGRGYFYMKDNKTSQITTYSDKVILKNELTGMNLIKEPKEVQKMDSILFYAVPTEYNYVVNSDTNPTVKIKAEWLPVSFWNFAIVIILLIIFVGACYLGKRIFESSKWLNSSNSPYPQS
ncbi:hypothetical protein J3D55_000915 [Chryseobacterium ginsenosidimutans]|uniref:DUF4178 domain-containing protein n=1 Tax=Chryseobacterium ginsenosidimutans TaxID=687846 RepID=UPI0021683493|nr:DUF4178 domain-containing protein [Chryseobacterium ginsenosidimutans]MCS3867999.1 hypothetical protein [Chryseobacterium ginsenosidimutans]